MKKITIFCNDDIDIFYNDEGVLEKRDYNKIECCWRGDIDNSFYVTKEELEYHIKYGYGIEVVEEYYETIYYNLPRLSKEVAQNDENN